MQYKDKIINQFKNIFDIHWLCDYVHNWQYLLDTVKITINIAKLAIGRWAMVLRSIFYTLHTAVYSVTNSVLKLKSSLMCPSLYHLGDGERVRTHPNDKNLRVVRCAVILH